MQVSQIACLGLSHHTAPVELRERLTCSLVDLNHLLPALGLPHNGQVPASKAIREIVVLSTCNRMEVYALLDTAVPDPNAVLTNLLSQVHSTDLSQISDHLYYHHGIEVAEHLCRVAAGLDSMVLGEPQILGQVTEAYMSAIEARTIGPGLSALFQTAIRTGKRARTETSIGNNPASISSMAIAQAQHIIGDLGARHTLVIGLGEMGNLALKALRARGISSISVANRTKARAETVAAAWNGTAYGLDELPAALQHADVVISATAAPQPVLTRAMLEIACAQREPRPLVLLDIAVPRDIETAVSDLPCVHLYDVDDLQESLDEALAARQAEIPHVEAIIRDEVCLFDQELRELTVQPVIIDLRQKAEAIRRRELERTLRYLRNADPQTLDHIHHLSRSLVNKLLHEPTRQLRAHAQDDDPDEFAAAVRELFGLEPPIEN